MEITTKSVAVALALAVLAFPMANAGSDGSNAANKTSAAGSTVEFLGPLAAQTVLSTSIKTSTPQDLLFSVTMECALWTTVATVGNDVSEARATVTVRVLLDGVEVPVSANDADGSVVFCDRLHRQTTTDFDDEDARIENYLATRSANAFNWVLPDVGHGVHTVDVVADLMSNTEGAEAIAQAGVGHRTLIVEPIHMAQGATVDDGLAAEDSEAVLLGESSSSDEGIVESIVELFGFSI